MPDVPASRNQSYFGAIDASGLTLTAGGRKWTRLQFSLLCVRSFLSITGIPSLTMRRASRKAAMGSLCQAAHIAESGYRP